MEASYYIRGCCIKYFHASGEILNGKLITYCTGHFLGEY